MNEIVIAKIKAFLDKEYILSMEGCREDVIDRMREDAMTKARSYFDEERVCDEDLDVIFEVLWSENYLSPWRQAPHIISVDNDCVTIAYADLWRCNSIGVPEARYDARLPYGDFPEEEYDLAWRAEDAFIDVVNRIRARYGLDPTD